MSAPAPEETAAGSSPELQRHLARIERHYAEQQTVWEGENRRAFAAAAAQIEERRRLLQQAAESILESTRGQIGQAFARYQDEAMEDMAFRRTILEKQQAQMDHLRGHVTANLSNISQKKAQMVEEQFLLLSTMLLKKQEALLKEEESVSQSFRRRIAELTEEIGRKSRMLHEGFLKALKEEFSAVLTDLERKQKAIDQQIAERVRRQRSAAERSAHEARQAMDMARQEYRQRHEQNLRYLRKNMTKCRELLENGLKADALRLQREVVEKVHQLQRETQSAFTDAYDRVRTPLLVLQETEKASVEQLMHQGEDLFTRAGEMLEQQQRVLTDSGQDALYQGLEAQLQALDTQGLGLDKREQLLDSTRERMEKLVLQRRMECERQHEGVVVSAKNQMIEMERETITFRDKFIEEQQHIMEGSEMLLRQLEQDRATFQDIIRQEELEALRSEAERIQALVRVLSDKHQQQWDGQRHKVIDAKLQVGSYFARQHEANEKRSHDQQQQTMQEMVAKCNQLVANYVGIEQQQKMLMLDEKEELRQLLSEYEGRKNNLKAEHEARRRRAQFRMDEEAGRAENRKQSIHLEQKKLLAKLGEIGRDPSPEYQLLKQKVQAMRDSLTAESQGLDAKIAEAKRDYREACDASQVQCKEELNQLRQKHDVEIAEVKVKMAKRQQVVRQDELLLQQEHRRLKEAMDRQSNSQFADYKGEQKELFIEAQKQLHQLEKNLLAAKKNAGKG